MTFIVVVVGGGVGGASDVDDYKDNFWLAKNKMKKLCANLSWGNYFPSLNCILL